MFHFEPHQHTQPNHDDFVTQQILSTATAIALFRIMTTYNTNMITPEQLAGALVTNEFSGSSKEEALDSCFEHLASYGLLGTTMTLKCCEGEPAPKGHGQFRNRGKKFSSFLLYCKNCTTYNGPTLNENNGKFQCTVIGSASIKKDNNTHTVTLKELYPHACRLDSTMSMQREMGGWCLADIDFGDIIGETLDTITNHIEGLTKSDLPLKNNRSG